MTEPTPTLVELMVGAPGTTPLPSMMYVASSTVDTLPAASNATALRVVVDAIVIGPV